MEAIVYLYVDCHIWKRAQEQWNDTFQSVADGTLYPAEKKGFKDKYPA